MHGWLSNREYRREELLDAGAPQETKTRLRRFFHHSAELLSSRDWSEAELQGHLLLSCLAFCAVSLLRLRLRTTKVPQGFRLTWMRSQKASVHGGQICVEKPDPDCGRVCRALRIPCPESLRIVDGGLNVIPAKKRGPVKSAQSRKKKGSPAGSNRASAAERNLDLANTAANAAQKGHR